jgi:hypothetical protein
VGFKDIKNSIKIAAMLAGKYRSGRFVIQFNFASLILESEAITPFELLVQDLVLNFSIFTGDLSAGYRIWGVKHEFDKAIFNGHAKGWYTRFGFQF